MSETVKTFIATSILGTSSGAKSSQPSVEVLTEAIGEITLETTTQGGSTLAVQLIDPYWVIVTSGWLDADPTTGILDKIETEYPEGSGSFWRLCSVDLSRASGGANVTLTFEDRIVAQLRERWGAKTAKPGTRTRAQFVRSLVDEVSDITFVCPSINVRQPLEKDTYTAKLRTRAAKRRAADKKNKERGIGVGAAVTVKGSLITPGQIAEANALLGVAAELRAPGLAVQALVFAGIAESGLGAEAGAFTPNSAGYYGVLQGNAGTWPDPHDTAGMARAFLTGDGNRGFQGGGAIKLAQTIPDPVEIAVKVEVPSIWPDNAYASEAGFSNFLPEARSIIDAYGGLTSRSPATITVTRSDVSQLARGTTDDPGEGSWECLTRLANEVDWCLFSNGDTLYYMDGPDLIAQKPAAYVDVLAKKVTRADDGLVTTDVILNDTPSATFDNTAFTYTPSESGGAKRPRVRRGASASTPTEIRIDLVCEVDDYRGGDVFVFHNAGPINGRWIVNDATRNVFADVHTSFTLGPSIAPLPEPTITSTRSNRPPAGGSVSPTGYVNPFKNISNLGPLRVDMGVDYSGSGTFVALGNAKVFCTAGPGWPGGTFIGYTLLDGAYKGRHVYHAENVTALVQVGQTVRAGDPVGVMHNASPHTEHGWASGNGDVTLAAELNQQFTAGDPGAWSSAAGISFNRLLVSLGCPSGSPITASHGTMPRGFP